MATRRKGATRKRKTKRGRVHTKPRKKAVGAAFRKRRTVAKKRITKRTVRKRTAPVVQDTIIDIVDEPLPGVVRVTEIEGVSITTPDEDEE